MTEETKTLLKEYGSLLKSHVLFHDLKSGSLEQALSCFGAEGRRYRKGDFLHCPGKVMSRFGFVLRGIVQVCSDDIEGNRVIMNNVTPGGTFGESLCFLGMDETPVTVLASEDSLVLWLSPSCVSCGDASALQAELQSRFTAMLAARTLEMNRRIQILSCLTLREKLKAFFCEELRRSGGNTFTVAMNRGDMAAYIGVNRSALSRELSAMKREGLIDFHKNTFTLLRNNCGCE